MSALPHDMIDLVFDLRGETLPAGYPFALWEALLMHVPQLADAPEVSVLPLKVPDSDGQVLLPKRVKLALRLPATLTEAASRLGGTELEVSGNVLSLGAARTRALQSYPTLHARLAAGADDEQVFMRAVQTHFATLDISANLICGRYNTLSDGRRSISGYSLVVHDLKPDASLHLQCRGIGDERRFGCGVFMPYKAISDLD